MPTLARIILFVFGLVALFWILASVVGWLYYVLLLIGVIAVIGTIVWAFTRPSSSPLPDTKKLSRKQAQTAEKELKRLEERQKNSLR